MTHRPLGRPSSRTRAAALLASAALAASLLAGCSGDDADPAEEPEAPGSAEAGPPPLPTRVEVGEVVGRLPRPARRTSARAVADTVDGWVDAAYVAGPWPREDFAGAFPGFTPGARARARADARLTTNAALGGRVEEVRATRRRVVVDLLAVGRRPQAATARVRLAFRTRGEVARTVSVQGRLFLTRTRDGWRIFGYDLARGTR